MAPTFRKSPIGERIKAFLDAYGMPRTSTSLPPSSSEFATPTKHIRFLEAQGQEPQKTWVAEGGVESEGLARDSMDRGE